MRPISWPLAFMDLVLLFSYSFQACIARPCYAYFESPCVQLSFMLQLLQNKPLSCSSRHHGSEPGAQQHIMCC